MKKLVMVFVLSLLVSAPTTAGEIPTGGIAPPPPPPPDGIQATNTTAPGNIPTDGLSYEITQTAIDLIQTFIGVGV